MTDDNELTFLIIGGHPAIDLLNTRPMRNDGLLERLTSLRHIANWAHQAGLISASAKRLLSVRDDERIVEEVWRLREALRTGLQKYRDGKVAWRGLATRVNAILKSGEGVQALEVNGPEAFSVSFIKPVKTPDDLLWLVASEIADFLASGEWRKSFSCEGTSCVLWFVDRTKNRSRHWCRMETCGARSKAKAYYQRKKSRKTT